MDALLTFSEVAIAMAGFSAVVVLFKRRGDETWSRSDADRFKGMVLHAINATLFGFVPVVLSRLMETELAAYRWASAAFAAASAVQTVVAYRIEARRGTPARLQILVFGSAVVALLVWNATVAPPRLAEGLYLTGIFWHVLQAGVLFVMLIWIPESKIDPDPPP